MPAASASALGKANSGAAVLGIKKAKTGNIHQALVDCLKAISPQKTWGYAANLLCVEERVAKHRLARTRDFTAENIATLLHSEHGAEVLAAIMATAPNAPKWWRVCEPMLELADIQRMQIAARRRITRALKGAIDADADLTAALARADALLVSDEDFYGPHADAVHAMSRLPDRAVAAAKRK